MAEVPTNTPHAPGTTSGSWERAPQELAGRILAFDLAVESAQVRSELSYQEGDRNANTLVKEPDFRIVLTALRPGTRVREHHADGRISVQTLRGRLRLHLPDQTVELPAGHLLALEAGIPHDVEALEESVFLLTIAWPSGHGAG
jgi:quercetin dioxygenase-like cupin family protein